MQPQGVLRTAPLHRASSITRIFTLCDYLYGVALRGAQAMEIPDCDGSRGFTKGIEIGGGLSERTRHRHMISNSATPYRMRSGSGFTLLELMFGVAVLGILTVLAHGQFSQYIERAKVEAAKADIAMLSVEILRYQNVNDGRLPTSLAQMGRSDKLDPWQRPYHYVDLTGKSKGKARKDKRLNPINSDFDLFSAGKNGVYKPQVSQKDSLDDVIRARDGSYVGLAKDF